jgi:hypothetical protein
VEGAHPGPQPALFAYPFAEARRAKQALEDAAARLQSTVRSHRLALGPAMQGFEGRTRHEFEPRLLAVLEGLEEHARALLSQADLLAHELDTASRRRDASVEARHRWRLAVDRWEAARREAARTGAERR